MMFVNSLKLFGSNCGKALKFFLYYIVIFGICVALLLPVFFEFKDLISSNLQSANLLACFAGVFHGSLGQNIHNIIVTSAAILVETFSANVGLSVYGLLVVFVLLPFLINIGKYALNEMLYSYMTSKSKVGFFSALIKSLKKSVLFALCKTLYNIIFLGIVFGVVYGLGLVEDTNFTTYGLPVVFFLILTILYSLNQLSVLGWVPALIVFDRNVFSAYKKGTKAVARHFWHILWTSILHFALFWALVLIFGAYTMVVLVPLMTALLCMYDMVVFFTSQGMRFYINENKIMTPKRLEEVDNINKTAFIL